MSLEERKQQFKMDVYELNEPQERLEAFFNYWSEHNTHGKKMRFEMAKNQPFNINRRMGTWKANEKRFGKVIDEAKEKIDFIKDRYGIG